jgi:hypothetical protein
MRAILIFVVLLLVGIAGLGFYRGWFQVSSDRDNAENKVNTTFTVDEDKIREDKEKCKNSGNKRTRKPAKRSSRTSNHRPRNDCCKIVVVTLRRDDMPSRGA